jgi:hypothetical protein
VTGGWKRGLAAALAGLAAGMFSLPALAQDSELRGTLETSGQAASGQESDASIAPSALEPGEIDPAIATEDPPIPRQDDAQQQDLLRRKRQAAPADAGTPASGDDQGSSNRRVTKRPERKGSAVNRLQAQQETAIRDASVRGLKGLEKQPNTAVNAAGEAVLPPGLARDTALETSDSLTPRDARRDRTRNRDRRRNSAQNAAAGDENPYTPLGIRAGDGTLFPSLSTAIGYDSNPSRTRNGDGAAFNRTQAELRLTQEGSGDTLEGELSAGYDAYLGESDSNRPNANGRFTYERDISATTKGELIGRLGVTTEEVSSRNARARAVEPSIRIEPGVTLGVTQDIGLMSFRLRGSLDRTSFTDVRLSNGKTASQDDRSVTGAGLALRAAYDPDGNLSPFIDLESDRRFFDKTRDLRGLKRDSMGYTARVGVSVNTEAGLEGEISAGYGLRSFEDSRLDDLGGFVFNAELSYQLTPLTIVTLQGETAFEDSTLTSSSGALSNSLSFGIEHELMRNLTLRAQLGLGLTNADDGATDTRISAGLGADYSFSREIVGTSRFNYEQQWSTGSADYNAYSVLLGVRLQR